ncbi:MAG: VWA domain-containing protein [Muribaculaceae bacterium]|nr:VWA domain-containing protein [Muribaculaceae bacterium]
MAHTTNTPAAHKTTTFNLLIIDESGSMSGLEQQTISGCNETLTGARALQRQHADSQRSLASIYMFQSGSSVPSRYIVKNKPVLEVPQITSRDYTPCGCTPLLDAIGTTLTDLEAVASTHEDAHAIVTIITDGYENSSTEYSWRQVADIINRLKELGWTFNFIGANIDVNAVASKINIDNRMAFTSDTEGTAKMWTKYNKARYDFENERIHNESRISSDDMESRRIYRRKASKGFFGKGKE